MKKLICALLLIVMVLSAAACAPKGDTTSTTEPSTTAAPATVTIYVPEKIMSYGPDGALITTFDLIYEEGWENKESFTITYSADSDLLGSALPVITYSDKKTVTVMGGLSRVEAIFDDDGRQISQTTEYLGENAIMQKMEAAYTYDSYGRKLTEEVKTYYSTSSEPVLQTNTYTYTDTETGSKGTSSMGSVTYVTEYDKDFRMVAISTLSDGQELSRTEIEFDENGNQVNTISYAQGQKLTETKTSFKTAEVSEKTAEILFMFKKAD